MIYKYHIDVSSATGDHLSTDRQKSGYVICSSCCVIYNELFIRKQILEFAGLIKLVSSAHSVTYPSHMHSERHGYSHKTAKSHKSLRMLEDLHKMTHGDRISTFKTYLQHNSGNFRSFKNFMRPYARYH